MRVLFLTTWYPSPADPVAGVFVRDQVAAAARHAEVAVLHCAGADRTLAERWRLEREDDPILTAGRPTWRVRHHPGLGPLHSNLRYLRSVHAAAAAIEVEGFVPDLYHAHVFKAAVPAVILGRSTSRPVIVTEHATAFPGRTLRRVDLWRARWALRRADRVLAVSSHLRAGIEACGIRARFELMPNVIDTELFRPQVSSAGAPESVAAEGIEWPVPSGTVRLLLVGGLSATDRKGVLDLLRALSAPPRFACELVVVGDGPGRSAGEALARDLGLSGRVRFVGARARSEVAAWMREADLFVLPSREETFGCAVLEALASGLPVVTTSTGIHADVVDDRVGRLVAAGNVTALASALREITPRLGEFDRAEMRRRALSFSPERIGARLIDLYGKVLAEPRRPSQVQRFRRSRFLRQVSGTLAAQVLALVFAVATTTILARALGPQGKGIITLATLVPSLFALFLSGGVNVANVYHAGSGRHGISALASTSTAFSLLATAAGGTLIAAGALTGALGSIIPGVSTGLLVLAQASLPFQLLAMLWGAILQGRERIRDVNASNCLRAGLVLGCTALFLFVLPWGYGGAVAATVIAAAAQAVWLGRVLRREGASLSPRWDRRVIRETLGFGLRGHVGNVLQFFNYRLDVFLLNHFLAAAAVGVYGVAVRLAEVLWFLPNAVGFVIFPRAASRRPEEMRRFTPRVCLLTMLVSLAGGGVLLLLGRWTIRLLFGPSFDGAVLPMVALLPGVVLLGGAKVLSNEISGRGFPHYNSWNSGVALVLTVVLCLILIPRYGILGAAIASSLVYGASFLLALIFYRATLGHQA